MKNDSKNLKLNKTLYRIANLPTQIDKKLGKGKGAPRSQWSDKQILEMRALSKFYGWRDIHIAERYGMSRQVARVIIEGINRAHLVPVRADAPADNELPQAKPKNA